MVLRGEYAIRRNLVPRTYNTQLGLSVLTMTLLFRKHTFPYMNVGASGCSYTFVTRKDGQLSTIILRNISVDVSAKHKYTDDFTSHTGTIEADISYPYATAEYFVVQRLPAFERCA